ncbi:uncharacterized protein EV420DRAFT_72555 [Desarmillaria tabescens]|uniref:Uncharacterized protein n=1 Tax=Armillaria tabescens TaxID=1929756 RepID=A0AA39NQP7_ARMTA|nr:uncharacterized protein EV420DRAFT_72555 [Desarmillaria tabescens]KAK0469864.1 hypothetical protein EV420DRAFT_72555 [Desarmillaria tabescens]
MATAVVDPVLQPITLANAPVKEKAEDVSGAAQRDTEVDPKIAADKPRDASTLPIVHPENKENAGTQEEQMSLSVSDDSTVPKVTPTIDDTIEIPTEPGMDEKASSIPVTVALTSDMASSILVERLEDTQIKNDNDLAGAIDSPIEISPLPAPVTPQDTKVDGIPTPTFEHQVKFVAPEQPDFSSKPSDVKTDVVAIDEVAPDALEGISSADKATMPDKVSVAGEGVPLVADTTVVERSQTTKDEAILGEEAIGEKEHPEVTSPMAQNETELKNIPIPDSVQSAQEHPTVTATSDVKKDAVTEDAIVIEKATLIEEKEKAAAAEGALAVEAASATITSEVPEAPLVSVPEPQIAEEASSDEQLVGAGVVGQPTVVADKILEAEGTTVETAKTNEGGRKEDLQLATTTPAKTDSIEDETPTVSVVYTTTVEEGEAPVIEAGKDKLEKTSDAEVVPVVEVRELDKGEVLPSVAIYGEPAPPTEEASIVEVVTGKEVGPAEAAVEGNQRSSPVVQTPVIDEPLAVVGDVSVAKVLTGADEVEEESSSSAPVTEPTSTAEDDLTFATDEPVEVVEPLEEASAAHAPFIPQLSSANLSLDDIHEPVKAVVAEGTSANEAAVIPTGDALVVEEVAGEQVVAGTHNVESIVETTPILVDDTPANHVPVVLPVPTEASVGGTELHVEKQLLVEDTLIVEEISTTEELSAVEQGVEVFNVSKNPPAVEEVMEEVSIIKPSSAVEEATVVDETSGVQEDGTAITESVLNEGIAQKLEERIVKESRDPVVEEVATAVVEPAGITEKAVAVVTSPVEPISLDSIPPADAAPFVDKTLAVPTAADDFPTEQEGKLSGNPVEPVVFEKADVIEIESTLKAEPDVDQSSIEAPVDVETEKGHAKDASIEDIAVTELAAEVKSVAEELVVAPRDPEPVGDGVSREERIEPSVIASIVEGRTKEDRVHAAPSSEAETTVVEASGIERNAVEEEEPKYYAPSSQEMSSTEKVVSSVVEERAEEGQTPAPVDPSVIEDNNTTDESPSVDSSIQVNDPTPVSTVQAPVVIDEVDLHNTDIALASAPSLDEIAVNPASNLPSTKGELSVHATETVSDQDQPLVSAESNAGTLLTPAGAEIERPKSPWTPFYSVTTQGPGIPAEEDIPAIEEMPLPLSQVPVVALTPVDSSAPLEETQGSSEILEDRPKSPWTPSYSVSVQGSPLHDTVTLDETEPVIDTVVSAHRDIPAAEDPASSQTGVSVSVETATEPVKDGSQEEESIGRPQSALVTEEQPEVADRVTSTPAPEPVIEKPIGVVKLPVEEERTSSKELATPDIGIERPASPQMPSYSATQEEQVPTAPEVERISGTLLVPEDVVDKDSSQAKEPYAPDAPVHEVTDEPEVTIISEPVVITENAAAESPTEAVEVGGHDSHAVEKPVQPVASPIIEPQSEKTEGMASTPKPDDGLEKYDDVEVYVKSHSEETLISSEELPAPSTKTEHSDAVTLSSSLQESDLLSTPLAHGDVVVEKTPEVEGPSASKVSVPEVQPTKIDIVPQKCVDAEAEAATELLPIVAEPSKGGEDSSSVKTASLQQESALEVIPTPDADVKQHVQVSTSEELLAPATEIERPSSPWTPSYSVTQQGRITPTSEAESILPTPEAQAPVADELNTPAEPTPEDPSVNVELSNETPQELVTVSDVSSGEAAEKNNEDVQPSTATDVEFLHESDTTLLSPNVETERPSSPWTPSYSVTQQGRASPVPESELDVESAEKEVPVKDGLDESAASFPPKLQHQVEPAEPVAVAHAPEPAPKEEPIDDESKSLVGDEIASSVLEHECEAAATQQEQAVASLSVPAVEETQVGARLELHVSSVPEPDVEPVVKEEPAEDVLDVHAAPPIPEAGTDLEPAVKDDMVGVEKHEEITLSSFEDVRDLESAVNDKQAVEGQEEAVSAAPESERDVGSSVKHETVVVSEPVKEEEGSGGEHTVSNTQILADESKPIVKDESGKAGDDEEAASLIPASIEREIQPETGHEQQASSPEVESLANDELVQEKEVTISAPEPVRDSKPTLEDAPVKNEAELHVEKAASPAPEPELQNVAPEVVQETEPAVKDDTAEDGQVNQVVSPTPKSVKEEHEERGVPPTEELLAKDEPAGDENGQQAAVLVPEPEKYIESVVEEKVQDEMIKEREDEKGILASPEPLAEIKQREEQIVAPTPEVGREIESTAVEEPVAALEPEQHVEPVAEAKIEQVTIPAPNLHPEVEAVEKKVEEPAADVLDEQATLHVPEPESTVIEDEPPVPIEVTLVAADKPASLPDTDTESKANDEQVEVSVTKEEPGSQKDAALPTPKAEAKAEEVQIVQEIESLAEEVEDGHEVVEEHDEQGVSTVQGPAEDEPTPDEQAAAPVPATEQGAELVVEAEDESVVPEPVSEPKETGEDERNDKTAPLLSQDDREEGHVEQPAPTMEESLEVEQAVTQPAIKEEKVAVEPVPESQQQIKTLEKEVEAPAGDVQEQSAVSEPAAVKDDPAPPELVTEIRSLVIDEPKAEDVESAVKGQAILSAPEPTVIEDEPVISPVMAESEPPVVDEPTIELDVEPKAENAQAEIESEAKDEEQPAVPLVAAVKDVPVISAPELVTGNEPDVEPEVDDVPVVIKSTIKDEQVEDKSEEPSAQAGTPVPAIKDEPEPQVEIELTKEEDRSVASEEQVPSTSVEQAKVEPAEEAPEPASKGEDVATDSVEENTTDSRELSVDTSSIADSTKSPWTPSHSMTTQDVGSPDVEMKKDLPGQAFPVTEEDSKSVGSLDTVNESADVVPDTLDVPFTRKRLESSASARLLRGALHKVPEGRASLDMAQGEFTKPSSPVSETSAVGIVESLTTATITTATAAAEQESSTSDESDGSSDDSSEVEHKGRWCVVM